MTAASPLRATRRTALLGGAVLVAGTACDLQVDEAPAPTPSAGGSGRAAADPTADPDTALVARARDDIVAALAVVDGAGRGRPGLARGLRELGRLHDRHLEALPGDRTRSRRVRIAGDQAATTVRVRAAETQLQRRLAEAAAAAESGALASLLASMSAAVAQRLALGIGGSA